MFAFVPRFFSWAAAHPLEAGALFGAAIALARAVYAALSRLVAPYPRLRAVLEAFAALGPDVLRFVVMIVRAVTGLQLPAAMVDARDQTIADLRAEVDSLRGSVARFASAQVPPPRNAQSGFAPISALVAVSALGIVLTLGALLLGCSDSQHDTTRYGTVKVYVAPEWIAYDRARIVDELAQLAALGPAFVTTDDAFTADVLVRPWVSPDCSRRGGQVTVGTRVAEVDPVCALGDDAFRAFVGHEIGHVLGMLHICREAGDGPDCSPSVTGRPALMNPSPFEDSGDDLAGLIATDRPTALDLAEFRRVRGAL